MPLLTAEDLRLLRKALTEDDAALAQGVTVFRFTGCDEHKTPQGACAIGYIGWKGHELNTVEEVEAFFGDICKEADKLLGGPAEVRWFTNHWDDTPRPELIRQMLPEIDWAIQEKLRCEQQDAVAG